MLMRRMKRPACFCKLSVYYTVGYYQFWLLDLLIIMMMLRLLPPLTLNFQNDCKDGEIEVKCRSTTRRAPLAVLRFIWHLVKGGPRLCLWNDLVRIMIFTKNFDARPRWCWLSWKLAPVFELERLKGGLLFTLLRGEEIFFTIFILIISIIIMNNSKKLGWLLFTLLRGDNISIIAIFILIIIIVIINSSKKIHFAARWRTSALAKIILLLVTVAMNDHCHPRPQCGNQKHHTQSIPPWPERVRWIVWSS